MYAQTASGGSRSWMAAAGLPHSGIMEGNVVQKLIFLPLCPVWPWAGYTHTLSKPGHLLCKIQAQKLTTDREHSISLACMRPSDWLPVPQSSNSTEEPGEPSRTSHAVLWGFGNNVLLHYHGQPGTHYRTQVALEFVIEINLFSNKTMAVNHHS